MNGLRLITNRVEIESLSSELQRYIRGMMYPFAFMQNDEVITKGEIRFLEDGSVEIKMIEAIDKGKGSGRLFVEHLKNIENVFEIWGESKPDAVPFWLKMGAVFEPTAFKVFASECEYEEDFLVPFTIPC
ncbi:hypothetical protein ACFVS2_26950 [Brevibacillus sp. NPDC058079]|uniref:hypothetical protein n=1 Tax=Brevibacillus sp. NPDC058079 TaxID=3346330 RepID=UPI0036EB1FEF